MPVTPDGLRQWTALAGQLKSSGQWNDQMETAYRQTRVHLLATDPANAEPLEADERELHAAPFVRTLREGGIKGQDYKRLVNTGITPGTAVEYAGAHIQAMKKRGVDVHPRLQLAVQDLYKNLSGRTDTSDRDLFQEQRHLDLSRRGETLGGRMLDFASGFDASLARAGTSLIGLVAPETANALEENTAAQYQTGGTNASKVGMVSAEILKVMSLGKLLSPATFGTLMAAQGSGAMRQEIARMKQQGHDISIIREVVSAGGSAAIEGLSNFVGAKIYRSMGQLLGSASPIVTEAVQAGEHAVIKKLLTTTTAKLAGRTITEGMINSATTVAVNRIRQGFNPDAALMEGVIESGIMGAVISPFAAAMHRPKPPVENIPGSPPRTLPDSTPEAVPPRTPLEKSLIGEEGTIPPATAQEAQLVGQHATEATPTERSAFFGDRTSPPTFGEEARFFAQEPRPAPQTPEPQGTNPEGPVEHRLSGMIDEQQFPPPEQRLPDDATGMRPEDPQAIERDRAEREGSAARRLQEPMAFTEDPSGKIAPGEPFVPTEADLPVIESQRRVEAALAEMDRVTAEANALSLDIEQGNRRSLGLDRRLTEQQPPLAERRTNERRVQPQHPVPGDTARQARLRPTMQHDRSTPRINAKVQQLAKTYTTRTGRPAPVTPDPSPVKSIFGRRIAKAYDAMVHAPNDPKVKASYDALKQETLDQFNDLKESGFQFDVGENVTPYRTVAEMALDVADNQHLTVSGDPGDMPADHPLMEVAPGTGGLTYLQVFRSVHDIYGHTQHGFGFTSHGEELAWRSHQQMYSDAAQPALATETRGQSTWVEFGPEAKNNRAAIKANEVGQVKFPPQKAGLLPADLYAPFAGRGQKPPPVVTPTSGAGENGAAVRKVLANTPPPEGSAHKRRMPRLIEDFITPIVSRIRDIAPRIAGRLWGMESIIRRVDAKIHRDLQDPMRKVRRAMRATPRDVARQVRSHLLNGERNEAVALLNAAVPGAGDGLVPQYNELDRSLEAQRAAGIEIGEQPGFFPRSAKDHEAYLKAVGDSRGEFERAFSLARKLKGADLNSAEKTDVVNRVIQGYGPRKPGSYGPSHARKRTIDRVPLEHTDLYHDPMDTMSKYISNATYATERAKFLGNDARDSGAISDSVGKYVEEAIANKTMNRDQQAEVTELLKARFTADMLQTGAITRLYKGTTYLFLLASGKSALNNLKDIGISMFEHGLVNTGLGLIHAFSAREKAMITRQMGLDSMGQEFRDLGKLSGAVDAALKFSGFSKLDSIGKETKVYAHERQLRKQVAKSSGVEKLRSEWEPLMGKEKFDAAVTALKARQRTADTLYMNFVSLASIHPLTLSNMPKAYLENPKLRFLYTLNTFTMQQFDYMRRNTIRQLATPGQRGQGLKNTVHYIIITSLVAAGVDWMRDLIFRSPEDALNPADLAHADNFVSNLTGIPIPDRAVDALMSTIGIGRYHVEKVASDPWKGTMDFFTPPGAIFSNVGKDVAAAVTGKIGEKGIRTVRNIPVVGELMYNHLELGAGKHLNEKSRETRFTKRIRKVADEAKQSVQEGDYDLARQLIHIANTKQTEHHQAKLWEWRDLPLEVRLKTPQPTAPDKWSIGGLKKELKKEGDE